MPRLVALLLLIGLLVVPLAAPRADDKKVEKKDSKDDKKDEKKETPKDEKPGPLPGGNWKVIWANQSTSAFWLIKIAKKGDKWTGEVLATRAQIPKATLESLSVKDGKMTFALKTAQFGPLACEFKVPKDDGKTNKLYGSLTIRKNLNPVELDRTTLATLDAYEVMKDDWAKAAPGVEALSFSLRLIGQAEAKKAKPAEVRAWAEKGIKSAQLYGVPFQREIMMAIAAGLCEEKGYEAIALQYAKRAERLLDTKKDSPAAQKKVLDALAEILEKAGKEKEAKEVKARLAKLDFRIKVVPFKGRKAKSNRVVLVELFTGAQCKPCIAADLAFDALGKTYKPSEVVLLQYHLHIPAPDPLTNADSEARKDSYGRAVGGTPVILFNGKAGAPGGGDKDDASEKYDEYREEIDPLLEKEAGAVLKLTANQKDETITINADVGNLSKTGDDIKLRVVLVEQEVAYTGKNGLAHHKNVVRFMPGEEKGVSLTKKAFKKTYTVKLADVKKKLKDYLEKAHKDNPFTDKKWPLDLKKLRVIAFIQNDETNEILQAAQADIKSE